MANASQVTSTYHRYHIGTETAPNIDAWPNRFLVRVNRFQLAKYLIQQVFQQRGDIKAVTSRPCVYGTFSGPIGGFAPRPQYCVGCLRCTVQHPETTTIIPNPAFQALGDSYFNFDYFNAIAYEAETGNIPVKGAGYRGPFGGNGWDGMWTDMSEIVRPTRDGIHGREFISTVVDIGERPTYLMFDDDGKPVGELPSTLSIPIPFFYDTFPPSVNSDTFTDILMDAALQTETLLVLPMEKITSMELNNENIIPLVSAEDLDQLKGISFTPKLIEFEQGDMPASNLPAVISSLQSAFPNSTLALRLHYTSGKTLLQYARDGIKVFHLLSDYHGFGEDGRFALELIREAHLAFVEAGIRDTVTLIGSGGIVAAEHVPKAIIAGLDLVALDTPLLVALQARFNGECRGRIESQFSLPRHLNRDWGVQRIKNMTAAWRDQLLEILGAMGLREVRRLRGEIGRAMFQEELEREAFADIEGYK